MMNPLLTLEVLLFWLPAAECPFPQVPSTVHSAECAVNDRVLSTVLNGAPNLARKPLLAWQPIPSSTSSITGPAHSAYIPRPAADHLGHDTARCTLLNPPLTLQEGPLVQWVPRDLTGGNVCQVRLVSGLTGSVIETCASQRTERLSDGTLVCGMSGAAQDPTFSWHVAWHQLWHVCGHSDLPTSTVYNSDIFPILQHRIYLHLTSVHIVDFRMH
ncbi:uncharacterized protein [Dermacentor andersoni]|uniref:uncharacterized protein n=1 Tax=Dermacentor andersoni TaxID=34620 RepID=UPI0024178C2A|nr:uncharacterized protein LOC129382416 [Dermacentor andersoni]